MAQEGVAVIDKLIKMDRESRKKILVVGDAMTDVYLYGDLSIGQEGCPKFVAKNSADCFGGAANSYNCLSRWNCHAELLNSMHGNFKTRFVVNGKTIFRHDDEKCIITFTRSDMERIICYHPDAILISDYDKGFLTDKNIAEIIEYANGREIPIVADAKRQPSVYNGAILKCNSDYAIEYQSCFVKDWVVTFGSRFPQTNRTLNSFRQLPSISCVNHVGAGDCFAAHLTLALAHGFSLDDAAIMAHSAGRVYVQHPHNRPPFPHEIRKDMHPYQGKIVDRETLSDIRESTDNKIVFTNGCFDLFGPHHLYLLQEAKKRGDILVVGLNSDEGVWRLKGPGRPVIPQEQRAILLVGLDCVDYVVVFDEPTPARLMNVLSPDIRVRGDFSDANKDGDEFAKMVVTVPLMEGWSTTRTMTAIQNKPR